MTNVASPASNSHKAKLMASLAAACAAIALSAFAASGASAESSAPNNVPAQRLLPREVVPTDFNYFYASASQYESASGAYGSYLVEDPAVSTDYATAKAHSLAELAVESSDGEQIIEVGWMVSPQQFGDPLPHLFVYHWVNGTSTCYNACGFVPVSAKVTAGMTLTPHQTSVFRIAYVNSNWGIYDNGTLFGYFPGSLWSGAFTSLDAAQWFGEVAVPAPVSVPCAQMGSGVAATATGAATISNMGFVEGSETLAATSLTAIATNPAYYSVVESSPNSISFGGPGGCAVASTTTISAVSPTRPVVGAPITVNVSVEAAPTASESLTPTGTVTVSDGTNSCQATLTGTNGLAAGSCSVTDKRAGTLIFTATYSGDANFMVSATTSTPVAVSTPPMRHAAATIHFSNESTVLSVEARRELTIFARKIGRGASVEFIGYAKGSRTLALQRAYTAARYLLRTTKVHTSLKAMITTSQNKVTVAATWAQ
jgi:hypothetical protein